MAVKIIVDSASDIHAAEANEKGVIMIPLEVRIGEQTYFDGVDILPEQFYEKLIESDDLPQTSQINPFRFEEVFEKVVASGDEGSVLTLSSKLSGTYFSAKQAAEKFGGKIYVVDSLNAAIGERLLCDYAIQLAQEGKSAKDIAQELEEKKKKVRLMAMLDTLEYLKKGGRVSSAVAFAGTMLSIKPVIELVDGEVKLAGKAMGSKKANNLLNALVEKSGGIDFSMPYGVVWSGLSDMLLKKYVQDSAKLWEGHVNEVPSYMLGCTIGTHVGPGAIGVAFFEK